MGKRAPKIPEGYERKQTGTTYQIADKDIGPGGYDFRDASKEEYDLESSREVQYDEVGGRVGKPGYDTREVPIWSLVPIAPPAPPPVAPTAPTAPTTTRTAPTAPTTTAAAPQPDAPATPATPAAPKVKKVSPAGVLRTGTASASPTGQVFGTTGRRPFRRAPRSLAQDDALTKKTKLGA
jgi:hypothetical protein